MEKLGRSSLTWRKTLWRYADGVHSTHNSCSTYAWIYKAKISEMTGDFSIKLSIQRKVLESHLTLNFRLANSQTISFWIYIKQMLSELKSEESETLSSSCTRLATLYSWKVCITNRENPLTRYFSAIRLSRLSLYHLLWAYQQKRMPPKWHPSMLWALTDSNRRPSACKADALNQLS